MTDDVLVAFRNLRRLALRNVSVYSNYPIRPQWAALKDGASPQNACMAHRHGGSTAWHSLAAPACPVLGAAGEVQDLEINAPRPAPLVDTTLREWIVACPKITALRLVCNSKYATFFCPHTFFCLESMR